MSLCCWVIGLEGMSRKPGCIVKHSSDVSLEFSICSRALASFFKWTFSCCIKIRQHRMWIIGEQVRRQTSHEYRLKMSPTTRGTNDIPHKCLHNKDSRFIPIRYLSLHVMRPNYTEVGETCLLINISDCANDLCNHSPILLITWNVFACLEPWGDLLFLMTDLLIIQPL